MSRREEIGNILKAHAVWDLWKTMPDGPEKYQAYLCSPEWGRLRAIVTKRSGGKCERCKVNDAAAVHHLTYQRKYQELPEDLIHYCQGCHDYTHGKSTVDPMPRRKLYLAGKVEKNCWRHSLVNKLREADWDNAPLLAAVEIGGETFDYVGPFFVSCDHGCYHGDGTHGCLGKNGTEEVHGEVVEIEYASVCGSGNGDFLYRNSLVDKHGCRQGCEGQEFIVNKCLEAIDNSDVVMAWIDTPNCFGTLCEIGFAVGKYKTLWVAFASDALMSDMWFIKTIASKAGVFSSPTDALFSFHREYAHA